MRKFVITALLTTTVSLGAIAYAQVKEPGAGIPATPIDATPVQVDTTDARSLASDQAVGEARRYYRSQCNRHESPAFCECVTAGVAQALMPEEVRIAARTIGDRITAQGDVGATSDSDTSAAPMSSAARIEQVESHYADACQQYRR